MKIPRLPALLLAILLAGCSTLDPHNIIGRRTSVAPISDSPVPSTSTSWRNEALDAVWTTVNERYYDAKLNGVDWRAARSKYETAILASKSDDEYWELLDKMTGELKDSHTRVNGPKQAQQQRDQETHSLGVGFIQMDDALVVNSVHAESDAFWAGVRVGMTILSIDGEPALVRYKRLMNEVRDSSTPWARVRGANRKISAGDVGTSVNMTFMRGDGSEISATIKRRKFRAPPETVSRVLPSGFGYVKFSNFLDGLEGSVTAGIAGMKDTPGLIVDLRNNGGGSLMMANNLINRFLADKTKGSRILTRTGKPITIAFIPMIKLDTELSGSGAAAYTKPLVILTNENSASASEVFSATLQDLGRATVIGQRTCGCLLGYLGYADLPGGGQLAYSELGFVTPKGKRIEGEGVKPDVEVSLTREDIMFGRDRMLEAAQAFLSEKTKDKTKA
jgi:carboxyl-terminal processing protease